MHLIRAPGSWDTWLCTQVPPPGHPTLRVCGRASGSPGCAMRTQFQGYSTVHPSPGTHDPAPRGAFLSTRSSAARCLCPATLPSAALLPRPQGSGISEPRPEQSTQPQLPPASLFFFSLFFCLTEQTGNTSALFIYLINLYVFFPLLQQPSGNRGRHCRVHACPLFPPGRSAPLRGPPPLPSGLRPADSCQQWRGCSAGGRRWAGRAGPSRAGPAR